MTEATQTTDLATVDAKLDRAIALMQQAEGRIGRVVAIANATKAVRETVAANWDAFMQLKDSPLGWSTDEREGGRQYSPAQLQTALTQAILKGGLPVNKEIGVISGQAYLQKPFFERQVRERGDISDVRLTLDVPETINGRTVVGGVVSWRHNGCEDRIVCRKTAEGDQRIPIKVNAGMGDDAILGKATRKILARMLARIDGSAAWEDAASDDGVIDGTATPATAVTPGIPQAPSKEELRQAYAAFRDRIKAAKSAAEVSTIEDEIDGPQWGPHWGQAGRDGLGKLLDARLAEVADKSPPADVFDRFIEQLAATKTVKAAGEAYDAFFGPASPHKWTPEDEAAGANAFAEHKEIVRPK